MKLLAASIISSFLTIAGARDDVKAKGIQLILEGDDCGHIRGKGGGLLRNQDQDISKRCVKTLFPPDSSYKYLPDITYTFWKCGLGTIWGCTCGVSRIETVPADGSVLVAIEDGEYISEGACNAQCDRGPDDKCWVCVDETGWNGYTHYYCRHKADIGSYMLGASGMTGFDCTKSCIKLEALPYELLDLR